MSHLLDRLIALVGRLEPHILKEPFWMAVWLGIFMFLGWRLLRAYVGWIARQSVDPKRMETFSPGVLRDLDDAVRTRVVRETESLRERVAYTERLMGEHAHPVESILPEPSTLRPGMVLIWNGRAWVGHPTVMATEHQPIVRKARGKGKKATVELDRPPTAWERITEDDDGGPDQT